MIIRVFMFFSLLRTHKITQSQAALLLHISVKTIESWRKKNATPKWADKLLKRKLDCVSEFPKLINPTECLKRLRDIHHLKHSDIAEIIGVETHNISSWLYLGKTPTWAAESLMLAILFEDEVIQRLHFIARYG